MPKWFHKPDKFWELKRIQIGDCIVCACEYFVCYANSMQMPFNAIHFSHSIRSVAQIFHWLDVCLCIMWSNQSIVWPAGQPFSYLICHYLPCIKLRGSNRVRSSKDLMSPALYYLFIPRQKWLRFDQSSIIIYVYYWWLYAHKLFMQSNGILFCSHSTQTNHI